jgi:chemotaxis signal transduction protein
MEGKLRINDLMKAAVRDREKKDHKTGITKEFLIVELGDALLGLHIEYLREVFDLPDEQDILPLPFVPGYVRGVINVRGEIVPVLNLSTILGAGKEPAEALKMVIIEGGFKLAFPVREIVDMKTLDMRDWRTVEDAGRKPEEHLLTQEFAYRDRTVRVIDVPRLFASPYLV